MATMNPLEQKARSSFLKGLIIALLIGSIVAGFLGMQIFKMKGEEKQRIEAQKTVMTLKSSVKSGEEITSEKIQTSTADANVTPNEILTQNLLDAITNDQNGNKIKKAIAKIDLTEKTILTTNMITTEDSYPTNDARQQEYNMIVLPTLLETGDTIDIRLRLPNGVDYIVLSKKKVTIPDLKGTTSAASTIIINVNESEILTMSAAIIDTYKIKGSKLYANQYTDPGIQNISSLTYVPSEETKALVKEDSNIANDTRTELITMTESKYNNFRKDINSTLNSIDSTVQQSGVESGTTSETTTQQSQRKTYLDSLAK